MPFCTTAKHVSQVWLVYELPSPLSFPPSADKPGVGQSRRTSHLRDMQKMGELGVCTKLSQQRNDIKDKKEDLNGTQIGSA